MKPNVILIVMDATRFDHLSCYGAPRRTSPAIDALAQHATLFENCFAASVWTPPSHAALFTGKYPSQCGVIGRQMSLDGSHLTIAEFLRQQGYRTGGVGSAWISRRHGFDYGFEDFIEQWERPSWQNLPFLRDKLIQKVYDWITHSNDGGDYAGLQWFKRWIDQVHHQGPFYGFLRFLSAHAPYAPRPRFKRQFEPPLTPTDHLKKLRFLVKEGRFSYMAGGLEVSEREWEIVQAWQHACILYIDSLIGRLVEWLDRRNLLGSTLLIVTADHGENFGDHGLADHQYCIYDTLLHVPLVIAGPKEIVPAGTRISSLVSLVDVLSSLAKVIGAQDALPPDLASQSFFPLEAPPARDAIFAEYGPPYSLEIFERLNPDFSPQKFNRAFKTVRTLWHKYILASDGSRELYDLTTDPGEQVNVVTQFPELAAQLHDQLMATLGDFATPPPSKSAGDLSADEEARLVAHLKGLGYL